MPKYTVVYTIQCTKDIECEPHELEDAIQDIEPTLGEYCSDTFEAEKVFNEDDACIHDYQLDGSSFDWSKS